MTEKRFWLVPMDYYGEQRFVRDNTLIGEKSMSNQEVVDLLNEQDKEISELKQTIRGVYEILSIDVDVFSDKATEHDINAYIELRELDNKDAYYIAKGTKKAIELLKKVMIE